MRFVLVDRILQLEPGKRIVAEKYVSKSEDYFADHFPGHPVVPGVLLVEMMAQAAGKCLMHESNSMHWPVLAQIMRANFRRPVTPDSTLKIEATIEFCNQSAAHARATIDSAGSRVAEAALMFGFIPKKFLADGYEDEVLKTYLASCSNSV
jgi:3-hydroxyacyl-[acyl-carrier-protein] dehydratase